MTGRKKPWRMTARYDDRFTPRERTVAFATLFAAMNARRFEELMPGCIEARVWKKEEDDR